jgi:hypothetical protein
MVKKRSSDGEEKRLMLKGSKFSHNNSHVKKEWPKD